MNGLDQEYSLMMEIRDRIFVFYLTNR